MATSGPATRWRARGRSGLGAEPHRLDLLGVPEVDPEQTVVVARRRRPEPRRGPRHRGRHRRQLRRLGPVAPHLRARSGQPGHPLGLAGDAGRSVPQRSGRRRRRQRRSTRGGGHLRGRLRVLVRRERRPGLEPLRGRGRELPRQVRDLRGSRDRRRRRRRRAGGRRRARQGPLRARRQLRSGRGHVRHDDQLAFGASAGHRRRRQHDHRGAAGWRGPGRCQPGVRAVHGPPALQGRLADVQEGRPPHLVCERGRTGVAALRLRPRSPTSSTSTSWGALPTRAASGSGRHDSRTAAGPARR